MNKKLILGLVVLLLLAAGGYFLSTKNKPASNQGMSQDATGQTANQSKKGSLADLFAGAGGPSQTCTFENTTASGKSSGVIYTGDSKMRGDFSVAAASGKISESHMIVMDNTSYIWQDGQKTGMKAVFGQEDLDVLEPVKSDLPEVNKDDTDDEAPQGSYNCRGWRVDGSFFELPKDVEFSSITEMMEGVSGADTGGAANGSANKCAVCDSLSGEQKTQCLTALNCS